jgi:hypothetical protein
MVEQVDGVKIVEASEVVGESSLTGRFDHSCGRLAGFVIAAGTGAGGTNLALSSWFARLNR